MNVLPNQSEITQLIADYAGGNQAALDRLLPAVYAELQKIARRHLHRTDRGVTLETGALIHEAYLKLARQGVLHAYDRRHFLAICAAAMRQVIIDRARTRAAARHGSGAAHVSLEDSDVAVDRQAEWVIDVDRAIAKLRAHDERLAFVFQYRFFAGLSEEETAEALDIPLRSAQRDWMRARAWIRAELETNVR